MRILFTFIGGRGHLEPLIPIARAAERAGRLPMAFRPSCCRWAPTSRTTPGGAWRSASLAKSSP